MTVGLLVSCECGPGTIERGGACLLDSDSDKDGVANSVDVCPYDSSVSLSRKVDVDITGDTNYSHTLCSGTEGDSYRINLEVAKAYRVAVSGPPYPSINVLDSRGATIKGIGSCANIHVREIRRCWANVNNQSTVVLPAADGRYTLQVRGASAQPQRYTLRVVTDTQRVPVGSEFTTIDTDKLGDNLNAAWWILLDPPNRLTATLRGKGTSNLLFLEMPNTPGSIFDQSDDVGDIARSLATGSVQNVAQITIWDGLLDATGGTPAGWKLLFTN